MLATKPTLNWLISMLTGILMPSLAIEKVTASISKTQAQPQCLLSPTPSPIPLGSQILDSSPIRSLRISMTTVILMPLSVNTMESLFISKTSADPMLLLLLNQPICPLALPILAATPARSLLISMTTMILMS
ncbi:MAG TPA: hypothetical protein QF626_02555 [Prochlorococcaceae cyanobacterium Fu_MAG_50]|nr:hypothetical protein [Prochlorococcaceae cyanobacterium Fu_MAG_50]